MGVTVERMLLRIPEVADRLTLSRSKVYELIRSGDLPSVQIGRVRHVRLRDLESFVGALLGGDRDGPAS